MKRIFIAIGMVALMFVAGTNIYVANMHANVASELNLENIEAIGQEPSEPKGEKNYLTGPRERESITITTVYYDNNTSEQQREIKGKDGRVTIGSSQIGGTVGGNNGSSSSNSSSQHIVYSKIDNVYGCYCECENDNYCTDYIP